MTESPTQTAEGFSRRLDALKKEHADLDDVIARLADQRASDPMAVQRLEKRKLLLREQISRLEQENEGTTEGEISTEQEIDSIILRVEAGITNERRAMDALLSRLRTAHIIAAQIVALGAISAVWRLARTVEDLLELQTKVRASLEIVGERLKALEDRMTKLEAEQTQIITEARSAATAASTAVAGAVISDAVTRITRLEGRADQFEQRRLPPS